ncbi:MAG: VOC family protein [Verrucomicrobiales bacterium]|nr:VOC family protein [Verrucomicrobiales bacterium]
MDAPPVTVSISLTVSDGHRALDFYRDAFGAKEEFRMDTPDGGIGHAEFLIGESRIFLSEESEDWNAYAMPEGTMASCLFSVMTSDCDGSMEKAEKAGARILSPAADQFWGARSGVILDPFGYRWSFVQPTEKLTAEEVRKRAEQL